MAYRHYYLTEPGADLLAKWLEDRGKDCPEWLLDEDVPELDKHYRLNLVAECFGSEIDSYVLTVLTDRPNPLTSMPGDEAEEFAELFGYVLDEDLDEDEDETED